MLIHSFQLAKRLVKMGNHMGAARMLVRVSGYISQFPSTTVNILTTTVAECTQAGLKQAAYKQSCILVRPENIDQVNPKFKKKVESIARKPVKQDDDPEPLSPCPHCNFQIPESQLDCPSCKNHIPFCIASGKHMTLSDWSQCPSCKMCANYSDLKRVLEHEAVCPMCDQQVQPMMVKISDDVSKDFKTLVGLMKDANGEEDEDENGEMDSDDGADMLG
jgi:WD repeat-containing protein 19